jgi:hypothetical protein
LEFILLQPRATKIANHFSGFSLAAADWAFDRGAGTALRLLSESGC